MSAPTHKIQIIPAILPMTFADVESGIEAVRGAAKMVQIDICDGRFVPNATWPYRKHDDSFDRIIREEVGMPGWEDLDFEIDLMADAPQDKVHEWIQAGASRIIIHVEAEGDVAKAIDILNGAAEAGIALDIETPIDEIATFRDKVTFVQLMGIDNVGFQHQAFDDKAIGRVKECRLKYPGLPISVDGGVSLETAPALIAAGADRLVVGSAIYGTSDPLNALEAFRRLARDGSRG